MKLRTRFLWIVFASLLAGTFAQHVAAAPQGWPQFYTVEGVNTDQKLAQDARGNVYVGGSVWTGELGTRVAIIKYTGDGHRLWAYVFDSALSGETRIDDNLRSLALDAAENLYVAVARFTPRASLIALKFDPQGNLLWQQPGEGFAAELGLDAAGNCFVAGTIEGTGPQSFLIKFSPDGQRLWERRYVSSFWPYWGNAISLAVDPAGNAFVVGFQYTISKFDAAGNELWRRDYDGQSATRVLADPSGNAYVSGTRLEADALTVKLDPDGRELWKSLYSRPGARWNNPTDLAFDSRGNVYFPTFSDTGDLDIVKLNPDGTLAWHNAETGVGEPLQGLAYLNNLAVDEQGRTWFLFSSDSPSGPRDAVLSSYGPNGQRLSRTNLRIRPGLDELAGDILLDQLGRPVVTFTAQPWNISGWITMKLPQTRTFGPVWRPPHRHDW